MLTLLQNYWWLLISILGAVLVFMLFVQGGQTMLFSTRNVDRKAIILKAIGRKWELTFTSLVVFGGAFFASFPLFYSTSFGGAYWLWILILFSFIMQAVSYEYRNKPGNVYGKATYDTFLFINGCVGCILLGVAVAMMFFGAEFTVSRGNLLDANGPVISTWASTHGFEAIFNIKNLILGFAVLFLARTLACLYMVNYITSDKELVKKLRKDNLINGLIFVVFFLVFLALLLNQTGYREIAFGDIITVPHIYLFNYIALPWLACAILLGVVGVLYGILRTFVSKVWNKGIWFAGIGTILVVISLFGVAGYNSTAYYPSLVNVQSSLTISNSSSSEFTLKVMSYVSLIIPFVIAYIWYVWRSMDDKVKD